MLLRSLTYLMVRRRFEWLRLLSIWLSSLSLFTGLFSPSTPFTAILSCCYYCYWWFVLCYWCHLWEKKIKKKLKRKCKRSSLCIICKTLITNAAIKLPVGICNLAFGIVSVLILFFQLIISHQSFTCNNHTSQ